MQATLLLGICVVTTIAFQLVGFGVSQVVSIQWPTAGLMTFLVLFTCAFGFGWPIAVRIAEWAIQTSGFVLETEQSAGASRRGHYARK